MILDEMTPVTLQNKAGQCEECGSDLEDGVCPNCGLGADDAEDDEDTSEDDDELLEE